MTRPDLGAGYDGWQVLDPTPQEKSEGTTSSTQKLHPPHTPALLGHPTTATPCG